MDYLPGSCSSSCALRKEGYFCLFFLVSFFLLRMLTHCQTSLWKSLFLPDTESEITQEMGSPATPHKFRTEAQESELRCLLERRELNTSLVMLSVPSSFVTLFCLLLLVLWMHSVFMPNAHLVLHWGLPQMRTCAGTEDSKRLVSDALVLSFTSLDNYDTGEDDPVK